MTVSSNLEERAESFHAGDGLIEGEFCDLVRAFEVIREEAFRAGYQRGFYSNGNFFPDESWRKYANQAPPPPRREPTLEERPY